MCKVGRAAEDHVDVLALCPHELPASGAMPPCGVVLTGSLQVRGEQREEAHFPVQLRVKDVQPGMDQQYR